MSKAVKKAARKFRKIQKLHSEGPAGKAELKRMQIHLYSGAKRSPGELWNPTGKRPARV
jgi:hypothetical protein